MSKLVLAVVPLRLKSTRLPEKVLKKIGKWSMASQVVSRVQKAFESDANVKVIVAVGDEKTKTTLQKELKQNAPIIYLTDPELPSGTDRVFAAAQEYLKQERIAADKVRGIINIQGDTPYVGLEGLRQVAGYLRERSNNHPDFVTLAQKWPAESKYTDLAAVKVLCNRDSESIYFSRHPIPFSRVKVPAPKKIPEHVASAGLHIGVYGYTVDALTKFCAHAPTPLELTEGLEQLRALWLGTKIKVLWTVPTKKESFRGVDTPADFRWAQKFK